jgi:CubicO group peptidase (beta-lactamase class C family)
MPEGWFLSDFHDSDDPGPYRLTRTDRDSTARGKDTQSPRRHPFDPSPFAPTEHPEAQGIASSALLAFARATEEWFGGLHGFMLLRHGHVVASGCWAPYGPEHPHDLFYLTRSFTSTAVCLAAAGGRPSVDDRVLTFFPDDAPAEAGEHLAATRVRHLLTMTTCHSEEPSRHLGESKTGTGCAASWRIW